MYSVAGCSPPRTSTTISQSVASASSASSVSRPSGKVNKRGRSRSRTRTRRRTRGTPARCAHLAAFSVRARATPPPTTPSPRSTIPTSERPPMVSRRLLDAANGVLDLLLIAARQTHVVSYFDSCLLAIEPFLIGVRGDGGFLGVLDRPVEDSQKPAISSHAYQKWLDSKKATVKITDDMSLTGGDQKKIEYAVSRVQQAT